MRTRWMVAALLASLSQPALAQVAWQPVPLLHARWNTAMAFDPVRQRAVLFGGGLELVPTWTIDPARLLGDTWEWDGVRWLARRPKTSPSPRIGHQLAWDPVQRGVLLYGGMDATGVLDDTWLWNGQDWRKLTPARAPGGRYWHGMACDPGRSRIVLFGGYRANQPANSETWEWDGATWAQRQPVTVPPAGNRRLAYCARSRRLTMQPTLHSFPMTTYEYDGLDWRAIVGTTPEVVQGMAAEPSGGVLAVATDGTWRWDGAVWQNLGLATRAALRNHVVLADEPSHVLAIGDQFPEVCSRFDGSAWSVVARSPLPPGHEGFHVVHDERQQRTLALVSVPTPSVAIWTDAGWRDLPVQGAQPSRLRAAVFHLGADRVFALDQSSVHPWLFDGQTWVERPSPWVPLLSGEPIAYDVARQRVVVFTQRRETWEWDVTAGWLPIAAGTGPSVRVGAALAHDPLRRRTVLFGGAYAGDLDDTWEWDGQRWLQALPRRRPPARQGAQLHWMPPLGGLLLFGGMTASSQGFRDAWLYDGVDWQPLTLSGPPNLPDWRTLAAVTDAGRGRLRAITAAEDRHRIVGAFELAVDRLRLDQPHPRPGQRVTFAAYIPSEAGRPLLLALSLATQPGIPLRPGPTGFPELLPLVPDALFTASLGFGLSRLLDAQGRATSALDVPNQPSLIGLQVHAAGVTLAPSLLPGAVTAPIGFDVVR